MAPLSLSTLRMERYSTPPPWELLRGVAPFPSASDPLVLSSELAVDEIGGDMGCASSVVVWRTEMSINRSFLRRLVL